MNVVGLHLEGSTVFFTCVPGAHYPQILIMYVSNATFILVICDGFFPYRRQTGAHNQSSNHFPCQKHTYLQPQLHLKFLIHVMSAWL